MIQVKTWEQDPGLNDHPSGGMLINVSIPDPEVLNLPIQIVHPSPAPVPGDYAPGTAAFRYWAGLTFLYRGITYWKSLLPEFSWQQDIGAVLPVNLEAGENFNAYYSRLDGLNFYYGNAGHQTVYAGESADIVCHELGHAILDIIRPALFDTAYLEAAAFHESFGDMSALLSGLQVQSLRQSVLQDTSGILYSSSRLSKLAEQMGWAIRQVYPDAVEKDCLRNAVNKFFYQKTDLLPGSGPASVLSKEAHSFSRVFTAAFFEGLAAMFRLGDGSEAHLQEVSIAMGKVLIGGIRIADVVPAFFSQVAAGMVAVAKQEFDGIGYDQCLRGAFVKHGILDTAVPMQPFLKHVSHLMAFNIMPAHELSTLRLSVSEFELGVDTILVHANSGDNFFAMAFNGEAPKAPALAAKEFLKQIVSTGKLKPISEQTNMFPVKETYTHELRKEGEDYMLKRIRIDCFGH
ncbi:hypothetical protein [Chitinophaga sancti]|uniref:hypothetical protein n=1 Tax=Chitinophaga sancti TaxID=1004 RepID=UPI003F79F204